MKFVAACCWAACAVAADPPAPFDAAETPECSPTAAEFREALARTGRPSAENDAFEALRRTLDERADFRLAAEALADRRFVALCDAAQRRAIGRPATALELAAFADTVRALDDDAARNAEIDRLAARLRDRPMFLVRGTVTDPATKAPRPGTLVCGVGSDATRADAAGRFALRTAANRAGQLTLRAYGEDGAIAKLFEPRAATGGDEQRDIALPIHQIR